VLVTSGAKIDSNKAENSAELYDPSSGIWTTAVSMNYRRQKHTAILLKNGKVLVAGGVTGKILSTGSVVLSTAELYNPSTGTWTTTDTMVSERLSYAASVSGYTEVLVSGE
ncbi:unnamed protein product, partial [Rotaria sp. Silwood1]